MPSFQAPRGMRDLLPDEAAAFDALQAVFEARALRYGYPRIATPIVEDRGVFAKSVGEASDIVGYEMYDVSLHGQGGLVLRPEGTAAVTRAFLEHGLHRAPRPVRFFYYEPMFRGQRPQLLRYRQFWQWGLECFGPEEALADVEIIDFTARLFAEVGLRSYELELNTIGDAKCQPKVKEALASYFAKNRDALSDESKERLERNPLRILDSKDPKDRALVAAAPQMHELLCAEDREHFAQVIAGIERLGHQYKVSQTLVRGLDYYTRTVFEFVLTDREFTKSGDIAVAAGGRYNDLVQTLGGPPVQGRGARGGSARAQAPDAAAVRRPEQPRRARAGRRRRGAISQGRSRLNAVDAHLRRGARLACWEGSDPRRLGAHPPRSRRAHVHRPARPVRHHAGRRAREGEPGGAPGARQGAQRMGAPCPRDGPAAAGRAKGPAAADGRGGDRRERDRGPERVQDTALLRQ